MMHLRAQFQFSAAHRLPYYEGPCFRMHGHNYLLSVCVAGEPNSRTGMILDFVELEKIVQRVVLERCDHHTLNDLMDNPTAENLVQWMWGELRGALPGLSELELFETDTLSVVYRGE